MADDNGNNGKNGGSGGRGSSEASDESTVRIPQSGDAGAGRVLNNRYALIGPVGGGGMATVYKARDNILGRIVAVKVLREQYAEDAQFVARFRREAQAAANLAHPNIVNVYDVGQDGDTHFIVMEFVSGTSLKDLITRQSPMPMDKAVNIAAQILAGLEYAHRSGLIHRDIKPQNVLITQDGTVKVTDFGIAKSVSDLGLTEAGMALGTAHYFSPEQARGERVVPQSDIYAVGVTLYEMLTGRLPFESESAVGLAYKHIGEMPVPPRHLNPNIPQRLEAIVMKALAKEPQQRYTSAAEMERALRSIQLSGQQSTMEVPVPAARPNVTGGGARTLGRGAAGNTGRLGPNGAPTGSMRQTGAPRAAYPASGAAAGAATRHVTSPIGAPASVAIRPTAVRVQSGSGGCSVAAVTFFLVGLLAVLVGGYIILSPQMPNWFQEVVIPSPTPTATVPTATPTNTPVPPTHTPTFTPTYTATPTNTPVSVAVPNLVGLGIQDASVLARQKGFVLFELERVESVEYPEGVVVQQDPPANKLYQQTRQISVRVSKGPPFFKLPNLANTDPEQARTTLEGAGLKVQILSEGSATVPKGIVIRTVPVADANVRPGDTVRVYVSLGETARVPNLTGIENADLAKQRLEAEGLILGNVAEADDPNESVPPGAVLSQSPQAGVEVEKGTPVDIVLRRRQ